MTKILLTRHGHVDGIRPARFRGRAELALTERGLAQADALARRIAANWKPGAGDDVCTPRRGPAQPEALPRRIAANWKPVAVFTSPLQRCVLTGAKIAV